MASKLELSADRRRTVGKQVKQLRRSGILPGVVYGAGIDPIPIQLDARGTAKTLSGVSASTLIDLHVDGETHSVLLRAIQRDVIKRSMQHIDFLKVAMDVRIRTTVPIELVGSAPAVKEQGGILVPGVNEIDVEALPSDLPDRITVDLSVLEEIEDSITVGDLYTAEGVRVLTDPDENVAHVMFQVEEEEEEEELEELVELAAEPELVSRRAREAEEEGEVEAAPEEEEES